ncbi:reverse transcriptase domain-containing protein, partial [Caerostris darwini]
MKLTSYKKNLAEYKRLILAKKKEKFQEYINSISSSTLFGNNFNIITNKKRRTTMKKPIFNSDGNLTSNIQESAVAILDFHFPWSDEVLHPATLGAQNDFLPISINETEGIINRIKLNKAVGTDGLPGEIIKEIFFANRQWFTALLNYLLEKGIFPETWKSARIVLLDKENKSLDHPSHFRPICVLPCWGKVFDKIIADKLSFHLEHDQILSNKQFGFRKNRSTILALKEII